MKNYKSIFLWILAIALVLSNMSVSPQTYAGDATDVSGKVTFKPYTLSVLNSSNKVIRDIIKDGVIQVDKDGNQNAIHKGNRIKFNIPWVIDSTEGFKVGDFFKVELPAGESFRDVKKGKIPLAAKVKNPDGTDKKDEKGDVVYEVIGTYEAIQDAATNKVYIHAHLNEKGIARKKISDGFFNVEAVVNNTGDEVDFTLVANSAVVGATLKIKLSQSVDTQYGFGIWNTPEKHEKGVHSKQGNPDQVVWTLTMGYDTLDYVMENENATLDNTPAKRNVFVVDHLPSNVDITSLYYRPTMYTPSQAFVDKNGVNQKAGQLTYHAVLNPVFVLDLKKDNPQVLYFNPAVHGDLDGFTSAVVAAAKNLPTVGIYEATTGGEVVKKVVFSPGSIPHDTLTYEDLYDKVKTGTSTLKEVFANKPEHNQDQINALNATYLKDGRTQGRVLGWTFVIEGKIKTDPNRPRAYDGNFGNIAEFKWDSLSEPVRKQRDYSFVELVGGAAVTEETRKISVTVNKVWEGEVGKEVTVQLYADGQPLYQDAQNTVPLTKVLSEENLWRNTFLGLPYMKNGNKVDYTVKELDIPGYESITEKVKQPVGETNVVIKITNKQKTITFDVTKQWTDNNIPNGVTEIQADVLKGDKVVDTVTLSAVTNWTTKTKPLPEFDQGGNKIVYTVKEKQLDGYTVAYSGDTTTGFTITNTKVPVVEFKVTKKWEGVTANDGYQDLEVKFNVFAKGKDTPATDQPFVLNKTNNWEVIVELPKTDTTNNQDFEYEVREIPVTGYTSKVTGDMVNGFVITNTKNDSQQPQPSLPVPTQPETSPTPEQTSGAQGTTAGQTTTQRDSVPENIPPTTTAATATTPTGTENIDEDDAARGGVTTTTTETANIDEDDAARGGVTTTPKVSGDGGELPHTGNLPNELFYSIGAFVALMGVLVLLLQKLKK